MEKRLFTYAVLGTLVWAILGSVVAAYYFVQYNTYRNEYNTLVDLVNTYSDVVNNLAQQFSESNNLVGQLRTDFANISVVLEGLSLKVNILLNYGTGTTVWHNNTVLPLGSTAFTAVYSIAEINYTDYGGELGILITSINGVEGNSTHGWLYWYWDSGSLEWVSPNYSAAKYLVRRGDTVAYTYVNFADWPPPPPT